jgi:hypothetical protein
MPLISIRVLFTLMNGKLIEKHDSAVIAFMSFYRSSIHLFVLFIPA